MSAAFIQVELQKVLAGCRRAQGAVQSAQTLSDVVRGAQVSAPSYLRALVNADLARVNRAAEARIESIFKRQLEEIDALDGPDRVGRLGRLLTEAQVLRGHFPRMAQFAFRAIERARANHPRSSAGAGPGSPVVFDGGDAGDAGEAGELTPREQCAPRGG